ncbi:zinc metalloproteinase nas-6-like [Stylophora pistillata]|uniref:Metalloendopeptidase n=1 Tax=Stylophora pistillata TaxID=50429 RepID=A0A2B4SZL0_STYPI|nr:zinc metalloproteinase nas-6-like [Stylophora pistillata]PFX34609.1 Zinc metalloproteinase nas-13 [Stylophora pistillata]
MLVHRFGLGLMFVHIVYLSAIPILLDDKKKTSSLANGSEELEPWEVNQEVIGRRGNTASFDGWTLYQGDIVLDWRTRLLIQGGHFRRRRAVKKLQTSRWPNGEIPYVVDRNLATKTKREIRRALKHWKRRTCLHFRHKRDGDADYIRFVYEPGCWSYVGRAGGEQKVSIGAGCEFMGTIIHEIGHAVGFWHEQSRQDRDHYIRILRENIQTNAVDQFNKMPRKVMDSMGYEYDYFSIMHYGTKFFSKNGKATIKIRKKGRRIGAQIGQRRSLSWIDVAQVHAMYNCNKIPSEDSKTCFNSTTGDGREYRGQLNYTEKGIMCQPWNERWPHDPDERKHRNQSRDGLGKHNYCRNPRGRRARPWCYTTLKRPVWQYCDIVICNGTIKKREEDT